MPPKIAFPVAGACLILGLLSAPFAIHAKGNDEIARRSWIKALNSDLKASIDYNRVKANPITIALFGVADVACLNQASALGLVKSIMPPAQARAALQRFDIHYCVVKHQNG